MADDKYKGSSNRQGQIPSNITYSQPWEQVNDSSLATNQFISGLGLRMKHYIFTPYVIGATQTGSLRNYDDQAVQKKDDKFFYDNNGMYLYVGDVNVIWSSNSKKLSELPSGYYPDSTASVTINRNYIDTNEIVAMSEFDKLVLVLDPSENPLEYATVQWEQIKHNPTGIDRLMFQAVKIDHLSDANGINYRIGVDFNLVNGNIEWIQGAKRPGFDNLSSEGVVMSIRYRYIPSFYIKYTAHELRSHPTIDPNTGIKRAIRGPMSAAIQIDWVFLQSLKNQEKDGDSSRNAGTGGNTGPK